MKLSVRGHVNDVGGSIVVLGTVNDPTLFGALVKAREVVKNAETEPELTGAWTVELNQDGSEKVVGDRLIVHEIDNIDNII